MPSASARRSPHQGQQPIIFPLPVAAQVMARTRFSPPTPLCGECPSPSEALTLLEAAVAQDRVDMVELSGPGDPLATPETTLTTARLVRERWPHLPIALRTLGCGAARWAGELAGAGVSYVELAVDAVHADVYEKIYAWIRPGLKTLPIRQAAELLVREQRHAVSALKFREVEVVVVTTLYPGINEHQLARIASAMQVLGADAMAALPYEAEAGAEVALPDSGRQKKPNELAKTRIALPLVQALLGQRREAPTATPALQAASCADRTRVAVASSRGRFVDLHLGQAESFLIFDRDSEGRPRQLERRPAPPPGGGELRWQNLATTLGDCFAVVVAAAGHTPRRLLARQNLRVVIADRPLSDMVCALFAEP